MKEKKINKFGVEVVVEENESRYKSEAYKKSCQILM